MILKITHKSGEADLAATERAVQEVIAEYVLVRRALRGDLPEPAADDHLGQARRLGLFILEGSGIWDAVNVKGISRVVGPGELLSELPDEVLAGFPPELLESLGIEFDEDGDEDEDREGLAPLRLIPPAGSAEEQAEQLFGQIAAPVAPPPPAGVAPK